MADVMIPEPRTLYAIADDLQTWFETLEMLQAEPEPDAGQIAEVMAAIDRIGAELVQKTDAIAGVLTRLETEQAMVKAERDRLAKRQKVYERTAEWLERYVVSVMEQRGLKQLKTAANTLSLRTSDAVAITDEAAVPDGYKTAALKMPLWLWHAISGVVASFAPLDVKRDLDAIRPDETIRKDAIKKSLKAGTVIPGADLEYRTSLVRR